VGGVEGGEAGKAGAYRGAGGVDLFFGNPFSLHEGGSTVVSDEEMI